MLKDKELVVWVTLTQRRLKGFLKRAHHLNGKGMFTVLGWSYWVDTDRNKIPMKWDRPTPGNSGD
jgi:hypothetical protein